jgi:tetratricopeptide (TPR) repeat protein
MAKQSQSPPNTAQQTKSKHREASNSAAAESWWLRGWFPYVVVTIAAFVVYGSSLSFGFVGFDDQVFSGNPAFSRVKDLWGQFTMSASTETYRPVFFATIVMNSITFGQQNTYGFHLVNVFCHVIASCLAFRVLAGFGYPRLLALMLTLVFTVHPVLTQGVSWIPGRNDPFVAIWLFSSLVALIRYVELRKLIGSTNTGTNTGAEASPASADATATASAAATVQAKKSSTKQSARSVQAARANKNNQLKATLWLVYHFIAFTLAVFSKETAVVFPAVSLLYLLLIAREKPFSRFVIACVVGWLVIDIFYVYCRQNVPAAIISKSYTFNYVYGLPALIEDWRAFPEFIGKMIVPLNLSGYASYSAINTNVGLAVLAVFVGVIVYALRSLEHVRWQFLAVGGVWLSIFLILPLLRHQYHTAAGEQDYLEHRSYVPLVGLLVMLGEILRHFVLSRPTHALASQMQRRIALGISVVVVVFAAMTMNYSKNFESGIVFWRSILNYNPQSALAWNSVGYYMLEGQQPLPEVEPYMEKACEIAPKDVRYMNGLAVVYLRQQKTAKAEAVLRKGLQMDSTFSDIAYNLAYVLQTTRPNRTGVPDALALYEQAIRNNPGHFNSYLNAVMTYLESGNKQRARELFYQGKSFGVDLAQYRPELVTYLQ